MQIIPDGKPLGGGDPLRVTSSIKNKNDVPKNDMEVFFSKIESELKKHKTPQEQGKAIANLFFDVLKHQSENKIEESFAHARIFNTGPLT